MSTRSKLAESRKNWLIRHNSYSFRFYKYFNFDILSKIMTIYRGKNGDSYNDVIIMADTETSKETAGTVCRNYVVAWTISIRAFHENIVTLYGHRPSEMVEAINSMIMAMKGDKTVFYFHNLSYDWVFLRKFYMQAWGTPVHALNTKPHYPLFIEFANGIILKDSLILAQRSLDKWAIDLDVKHKKAVGFWNYDEVRDQDWRFSPEEKTYIERDTLAGVECLDATMQVLNKRIYSIPHTATGIPREKVRLLAKENGWREQFLKIVPPYEIQCILEKVFHGGYTHNNRHYTERLIKGHIKAVDEASAYPFTMLSEKFPMSQFKPFRDCTPDFILKNAEEFAYIFKLIMVRPRLKSNDIPMPTLQKSKCDVTINSIEDNGRILCAEYVEIFLNEIDLGVIMQQYDKDKAICVQVYFSHKDYLPRWFTDFVYKSFCDKTMLKGGDKVLYSIAKALLNSLYGMCVQKPVKELIEEDYETGEYDVAEGDSPAVLYEKYVNNRNSVLPYQWGVWVTSYAFRNLHIIGSYAGTWLYSDTDSCYGMDWDEEGLEAYNQSCRDKLAARGYGAVMHRGREYWLGVCEIDGIYTEFISVGAKRYADRDINGTLKITVAGVPKGGVVCLKDDLRNFHAGFVFDGETTGKKQHTYFYEEDIRIDERGNERGDSIDLSPGDYLLASVGFVDWEKLFYDSVEVRDYE